MTPFVETVKNWGDFTPLKGAVGLYDPARLMQGRGEMLEAYTGGDPLSEREPGYGSIASYRQRMLETNRRRYEQRMMEMARLTVRAFTGSKRDLLNFQEAMSIGDFPNLFGDVIDRSVLSNYLETPYTYEMFCKVAEVNDFRPVKRFRVDGGTGLLGGVDGSGNLIPLEMGANYPEDNLTVPAPYTYQLFKRGKRMPFFWETFVNDDLNAIKDTPARFGRGARREEEYFATKLFANNGTFYSAGNKNIVNAANAGGTFTANNPPPSITALQQAIVVMMNQLDTTGQPISVEAVTLVCPPSQKAIWNNVLNTDYVWMADQGGTIITPNANSAVIQQMLHAQNWARNIVRLAVNYYLPIVDSTHGTTGWYLFANPESGRPAIEIGKLRGHLMPELFMKLPNSVAIGEGSMGPGAGVYPGTANANPMEGDFDTDAIHYKIRTVKGGTLVDPIMSVYSNGSGS